MSIRVDPGPCPICGELHTACTTTTGPILIVQLPARDEVPAEWLTARSESVPSEPTSFSTATYRGKKGKP